MAGFGNKGIRGGSMASSIQSRTGNVSSGSLFSKMTSYGMTGAFSALAIGGGLLAGVGYYLEEQERIRKEREREREKEREKEREREECINTIISIIIIIIIAIVLYYYFKKWNKNKKIEITTSITAYLWTPPIFERKNQKFTYS